MCAMNLGNIVSCLLFKAQMNAITFMVNGGGERINVYKAKQLFEENTSVNEYIELFISHSAQTGQYFAALPFSFRLFLLQ